MFRHHITRNDQPIASTAVMGCIMQTRFVKRVGLVISATSLLLLSACQGLNMERHHHAQAELQPRSASQVNGRVDFKKTQQGLRVAIDLTGLTPYQTHAIHIHANGDCSAADAASAGGRFNPDNPIEGTTQTARHTDDLSHIIADAQGRAVVEFVAKQLSLDNGALTDIKGRSVVVHERADDDLSQPAGSAGKRMACGVIKMV